MAKIAGLPLAEAIVTLEQSPRGAAMAAVLTLLLSAYADRVAEVSEDGRRAILRLKGQGPVGVRVAPFKLRPSGFPALFRFKTPRDIGDYQMFYFGGVSPKGEACADRLHPAQIAKLQTITTRAIPGLRE